MSPEPREDGLTRREFTRRVALAGTAVAAASWIGFSRHRVLPPAATVAGANTFRFADYRMAGTVGRIGIVTGGERAGAVVRALELIGGMGAFIKPGERVLLKVNAAFASPSLVGATTHPELLAAVIAQCRAAGAGEVLVTDNPIHDPPTSFRLTGIGAAAERAGARVVSPTARMFRPFTLSNGLLLRDWPVLAEPFEGVDRVIGISPVKDHHRSGASLTLKNWYGVLGGRRNLFHQDIHSIITELAQMLTPTLVILDGTASMMTNGPTGGSTGDLKPTRTIVASTDSVAADAVGIGLLGRRVEDLPYLLRAMEAGVGTVDVESLAPKRAELA